MAAHTNEKHANRKWWKEASVYQIYPHSFKDSNGDGIGDIPGIISKLDYLRELGVDVVWLSPVYKSPCKDMGYDISDYRAINPLYGTMRDVEALIEGLHSRGMKLVMDLVVNHTSDEHEWFRESRASKENPKRNWYVWRDPKYDADGNRLPPNNWASAFGGSAWKYDSSTDQYFLHIFTPEQADLDWEHTPVREAVHDLMKFWLDKGVDGFRMDVINLISKKPGLPDVPVQLPGQLYQPSDQYFANGPRLHEFLGELRSKVLSQYDTVSIGEMPWLHDPKEVLKVVGSERGELDMIFQFDIVCIDFGVDGRYTSPETPWDIPRLKSIVENWQTFVTEHSGWNSVFIENHDHPRSVSRYVDRTITDSDTLGRSRAAKLLATFEAGQSGTLFVYQGQELGMKNMPKEWPITEYKDFETLNRYKEVLEYSHGDPAKIEEFMEEARLKARDHARTPVQWDSSENAGFTTGTPWMRVNDDYKEWNAGLQVGNEESVFSYWKRLLSIRKKHKDVFIYGDFELLEPGHSSLIIYRRANGEERALIALNFSPETVEWEYPNFVNELVDLGHVLIGNYQGITVHKNVLRLRGFEAVVFYSAV